MLKVSFIIPTYNNQKTIEKCLKSIFEQSFNDYEIIVVNDGSTDKTREILKKYRAKLKIIDQPNQGAPAARNRGFKVSTGEYIFFCDADILLVKNALEKMVSALDNYPQASYVYSSFHFGWKKFKLNPFDPEKLKQLNYISANSLIRRRDFPGWDESLKKFQDWDLWLTMLEKGRSGIWIPEMLFKVQTKDSKISSWLPSFVYKIPWLKLKRVKEYEVGREVVLKKHGLTTK
ncbi:MAG: glycosyltransferase family A protein [Patescibacteria group bacterium]